MLCFGIDPKMRSPKSHVPQVTDGMLSLTLVLWPNILIRAFGIMKDDGSTDLKCHLPQQRVSGFLSLFCFMFLLGSKETLRGFCSLPEGGNNEVLLRAEAYPAHYHPRV